MMVLITARLLGETDRQTDGANLPHFICSSNFCKINEGQHSGSLDLRKEYSPSDALEFFEGTLLGPVGDEGAIGLACVLVEGGVGHFDLPLIN